jgi:putative hemolysin
LSTQEGKRSRQSSTTTQAISGRSDRDPVHERQRHARVGRQIARLRRARTVAALLPVQLKPDQTKRVQTKPDQTKRVQTEHDRHRSLGVRALHDIVSSRILIPALLALMLVCVGGLLMAQTGTAPTDGPTNNPVPPVHAFDATALIWKLVAVVVLIFVNALFAIAEYSLITVRSTRVEQLVEEGNRSAVLIQRMKSSSENSTRMMATIQTGVTMVATLSSALAATSAVDPLMVWLQHHTPALIANHAGSIALVLVTLPVAVLSLVIGEIAPKSLAYRHSERFALIAVHPVSWMEMIFAPAVVLLTFLSNLVVRPLGGTASFTLPAVGKEELEIIMEKGVEQGVVDTSEKDMITSVLDFGDTVARKVMTPRLDLTVFEVNGSVPDLVRLISASGHSRIPVYEKDLDNIVGIVHAKDLLYVLNAPPGEGHDHVTIRKVMRPAYFIPETKKVDELLSEFRRSRQQLAIVVDEYGVTSGLVTIEDLLEEIVGDIQDEYDQEEPMVQVLDARTSIFDGLMPLGDVNERMDLELPEDEADTIGGFVFNLLGHQAQQGERTYFDGAEFVVESTDGRRITKVRLIRESPPPQNDGRPNESSSAEQSAGASTAGRAS